MSQRFSRRRLTQDKELFDEFVIRFEQLLTCTFTDEDYDDDDESAIQKKNAADIKDCFTLDAINFSLQFNSLEYTPPDQVIPDIFNMLILLEPLNFTGLHEFRIVITKSPEKIEEDLRESIIKHLLNLKNVKLLLIDEFYEEKWNPHTFYLFSKFEINQDFEQYKYRAQVKEKYIEIDQQRANAEESLVCCLSIVDTSQNQTLFSDLIEFTQLLNEIFQSHITQQCQKEEKENLTQLPLIEEHHDLQCQFLTKNMTLEEEVICACDLIKIWEYLHPRLRDIFLKTSQDNQSGQFQQLNSFLTNETNKPLDLNYFAHQKLLKKINLKYTSQQDHTKVIFLLNLAQFLKGITWEFSPSNQSISSFHQFLQNVESGEFDPQNLTALEYIEFSNNVEQENLNVFLSFANVFPNLKELRMTLECKTEALDLSGQFSSIMSLIKHLNTFQLTNQYSLQLITFSNNTFSVFFDEINNFFSIKEQISHEIRKMNRDIDFCLVINQNDLQPEYLKQVNSLLRSLIELPMVRKIKFIPSLKILSLNRLLDERMLILRSIIAYYLKFATFMTHNPDIILADLFFE